MARRGSPAPLTPRRMLTVPAPAKLNLFLHVTGRRVDGYHLLESLLVLIDLADTIRINLRDDGQIERSDPLPGVPVENDLTWRAARLLQDYAGTRLGATISLVKRIPMGAGLGGGSSDAASVLLALNRLWSLDLPREELMRLALTLGADVPFFVFGQNAHASGIGEILRPMTIPRIEFALAIPPVHVATPDIFAAGALRRDTPASHAHAFALGFGRNDLQPVAIALHPSIADVLAALDRIDVGASTWPHLAARMSGSGSAVFRPLGRGAATAVCATAASKSTASGILATTTAATTTAASATAATTTAASAIPSSFRLIHTRSLAAHPLREFVAK